MSVSAMSEWMAKFPQDWVESRYGLEAHEWAGSLSDRVMAIINKNDPAREYRVNALLYDNARLLEKGFRVTGVQDLTRTLLSMPSSVMLFLMLWKMVFLLTMKPIRKSIMWIVHVCVLRQRRCCVLIMRYIPMPTYRFIIVGNCARGSLQNLRMDISNLFMV